MPPDYIARYIAIMKEIKARMAVIAVLANTPNEEMPRPMRVETAYLGIRKVLELIAMGSLLTNARTYSTIDPKMHERWNAKRLLDSLHKVNTDFYPKPVVIEKGGVQGVSVTVNIITENVLTREKFVEFYERCGKVLHIANPFGEEASFAEMEKLIPEWFPLTTNLLNVHIVSMAGTKDQLIVQMGSLAQEPTITRIGPAITTNTVHKNSDEQISQ